jgi:hypothetical protein
MQIYISTLRAVGDGTGRVGLWGGQMGGEKEETGRAESGVPGSGVWGRAPSPGGCSGEGHRWRSRWRVLLLTNIASLVRVDIKCAGKALCVEVVWSVMGFAGTRVDQCRVSGESHEDGRQGSCCSVPDELGYSTRHGMQYLKAQINNAASIAVGDGHGARACEAGRPPVQLSKEGR